MIGNDIIDLALASKESDWQRKGVLEKLFTSSEQLYIGKAHNPALQFWSLWSRKEAVYKIYNRETKIRAFIPLQLQCLDQNSEDVVAINGKLYFTRTEITSSYIYTTAVARQIDFHNIELIDSKRIAKDCYGIPYCNLTHNPVSITHHGMFARRITLRS